MSVIDRELRFPQHGEMFTHDEILAELKAQLAAKRLTAKSVADYLGIAPPRISEMIKDGKRRIQPDEMAPLARLLEMNSSVLVQEIPILGDVPAGNWREAVKSSRQSMLAPETEMPKAAYALKVRGDSMDLVVPDGAWIVIDPTDTDLYEMRLYVIRNGDGETTFKRYREGPARLVPASTNPAHNELPISGGDFTVLGRVIWYGGRL